MVDAAERVGDAVLAAVADEQDAAVAQRAAAVRAAAQAVVGLAGRRIVPGSQWAPWIAHGHDVLEAAEGRPALALGLGRAEALVARRPRPRTSCTARRSSSAAEPSLAGGDLPAIVASHGRRAEDRRPRGR